MKKNRTAIYMALIVLFINSAQAYEYESAVPLTIDAKQDTLGAGEASIRLDGNKVEVGVSFNNESDSSIKNGFYAYTPFFTQLGEGEENADKSFSDLKVSLNGKPVKLVTERRGFFLGSDITKALVKAGLDPLPDGDANYEKIKKIPDQSGFKFRDGRDWQGFVSYAWSATIGAKSRDSMAISYKALPQFSLENISGERFSQIVQQHCGDTKLIVSQIKKIDPAIEDVLVEKYQLPVKFINRQKIHLTVSQPATDSLGGHPVISLVCGLERQENSLLSASGVIEDLDGTLSILIISKLARP